MDEGLVCAQLDAQRYQGQEVVQELVGTHRGYELAVELRNPAETIQAKHPGEEGPHHFLLPAQPVEVSVVGLAHTHIAQRLEPVHGVTSSGVAPIAAAALGDGGAGWL